VKVHRFLVTAAAAAALAGAASPAAAARSCPPGTDDSDYCVSPPGRDCDGESKKRQEGDNGTPFSRCVNSRRHPARAR
jgi:hypothetical protein